MYSSPRSRILLNDLETDYFNCPIGLKQGDSISATLFSIFINDLAEEIKSSGIGLNLNEHLLSVNDNFFLNILLYADDVILMASNENDLQFLLNIVDN